MGPKTVRSFHDLVRHGCNLHVRCQGHCQHYAIISAWDIIHWARVWRWPTAFESDVAKYFRCTRCGRRHPSLRGVDQPATLLDFFPVNEAGWKMLVRRARD